MESSKFQQHCIWENSDWVVMKLVIKSPKSDDSGSYSCALSYNLDIIKENVSDSGQIDLHISMCV